MEQEQNFLHRITSTYSNNFNNISSQASGPKINKKNPPNQTGMYSTILWPLCSFGAYIPWRVIHWRDLSHPLCHAQQFTRRPMGESDHKQTVLHHTFICPNTVNFSYCPNMDCIPITHLLLFFYVTGKYILRHQLIGKAE